MMIVYSATKQQFVNESIALLPCAYLHNMKARVFISPDAIKHTMYRIEHGKIKPSKNLADALASMLDGNPEFLMIDEQKLVYETALDLAHKAQLGNKQTLIVKGGPGTGKSVVAINLLTELIKRELLTQYVSKNAAPREVFKKMLTGSRKKTHIDNMFKGSGGYIDTPENTFGALLVDETSNHGILNGSWCLFKTNLDLYLEDVSCHSQNTH